MLFVRDIFFLYVLFKIICPSTFLFNFPKFFCYLRIVLFWSIEAIQDPCSKIPYYYYYIIIILLLLLLYYYYIIIIIIIIIITIITSEGQMRTICRHWWSLCETHHWPVFPISTRYSNQVQLANRHTRTDCLPWNQYIVISEIQTIQIPELK